MVVAASTIYSQMGLALPVNEQVAARYRGRRVCVTGGAGFIGSHLVDRLLEAGATVTVIDDLSNSTSVRITTHVDRQPRRARFVFGSILDPAALRDAMDGAEIVFHLAAMSSVPRSLENPERTFAVNAMGTVRVAEAARHARAGRLVYAASSSAYGDDPGLPKVETMLPRPLSPYAASKLAGESIVTAWSHSYGLSGVCLRYFNIFGPRQSGDGPYASVIASFIRKLLDGDRPIIYGDGSASRDFTPVNSAVQATLQAGAADESVTGQVINIGRGQRVTILELARTLAKLTDRIGVEPQLQSVRPGDVPHSVADIDKARRLLGYEPSGELDGALAEVVAWFLASHQAESLRR